MISNYQKKKILIIDFGSQVTRLIARRIRDFGVYAEIVNLRDLEKFKSFKNICGLVFSGGPSTVTKKNHLKSLKRSSHLTYPFLEFAMVYS